MQKVQYGTAHWILNSAVMPAGGYGTYRFTAATWDDLRRALVREDVVHRSRVGYEETADLIERRTGVRLPLSREASVLAPGDVAHVVRLRYRVDPTRKGALTASSDDDWEVARLERLPDDILVIERGSLDNVQQSLLRDAGVLAAFPA